MSLFVWRQLSEPGFGSYYIGALSVARHLAKSSRPLLKHPSLQNSLEQQPQWEDEEDARTYEDEQGTYKLISRRPQFGTAEMEG